jgi:hypothetical protein
MLVHDVILPQRRKLKYTVEKHYKRYHSIEDIELLKTKIHEKFPDFENTFIQVLNQKSLFANNMFIMKKNDFEQMATWLFSILDSFEEKIDLNEYTDYQQRLFGFLSERLLTTWFLHQEYKIKELPLIYFKHLKN